MNKGHSGYRYLLDRVNRALASSAPTANQPRKTAQSMPLFNGNLLQLHALLVAAYSGVSKGIANKGLKPDVTRTYPQQYGKWYSMNGDERNEEHTALYNEWKNKVLRKIHAEVGGSAEEAGQRAFTEQPDGTSNQNRAWGTPWQQCGRSCRAKSLN